MSQWFSQVQQINTIRGQQAPIQQQVILLLAVPRPYASAIPPADIIRMNEEEALLALWGFLPIMANN